jgi:hypothetical protein
MSVYAEWEKLAKAYESKCNPAKSPKTAWAEAFNDCDKIEDLLKKFDTLDPKKNYDDLTQAELQAMVATHKDIQREVRDYCKGLAQGYESARGEPEAPKVQTATNGLKDGLNKLDQNMVGFLFRLAINLEHNVRAEAKGKKAGEKLKASLKRAFDEVGRMTDKPAFAEWPKLSKALQAVRDDMQAVVDAAKVKKSKKPKKAAAQAQIATLLPKIKEAAKPPTGFNERTPAAQLKSAAEEVEELLDKVQSQQAELVKK